VRDLVHGLLISFIKTPQCLLASNSRSETQTRTMEED
jgi:hypothetical protein